MDQLQHKSLITTPHNLTFSYYLSPNFPSSSQPHTPTLLFIHGYPDDAYMWAGAIPTFLNLPYPFIVLDLLGFGGSSKPIDVKLYNYKNQAQSIAQILDVEGVAEGVIPIGTAHLFSTISRIHAYIHTDPNDHAGHDWGSATAQRFYLYHKSRCAGLAILSLAYQAPSPEPFSLPEQNALTTQRFGYPQWEYWNFFLAPDAPSLMRENLERFYDVNHGVYLSDREGEKGRDVWMREMFCVPGTMRDYVTGTGKWSGGKRVDLKRYPNGHEDLMRRFRERMSRDGFEGPVMYYRSLAENTMLEDERELVKREGGSRIEVPVLYIGQTGDWVCRTDLMGDSRELVGDLEERVVEAGHWVLYEKPGEIAEIIKGWLGRRFAVEG